MKTISFVFVCEMPDGDVITSKQYDYEYNDTDKNDEFDTYHYDSMIEDMEIDKIAWIIKTMNVTHELVKEQ